MSTRHAPRADHGRLVAAFVRYRLALLLSVAAAALAATVVVQGAGAVDYNFCTGFYAPFDHCDGSAVALTADQALDDFGNDRVCAGAVLNGSFYGSYACGNGGAQHCYSGTLPLNPRAHNGENFAQQMHGHAWYNANCP